MYLPFQCHPKQLHLWKNISSQKNRFPERFCNNQDHLIEHVCHPKMLYYNYSVQCCSNSYLLVFCRPIVRLFLYWSVRAGTLNSARYLWPEWWRKQLNVDGLCRRLNWKINWRMLKWLLSIILRAIWRFARSCIISGPAHL